MKFTGNIEKDSIGILNLINDIQEGKIKSTKACFICGKYLPHIKNKEIGICLKCGDEIEKRSGKL
jgi:hypothetical protein